MESDVSEKSPSFLAHLPQGTFRTHQLTQMGGPGYLSVLLFGMMSSCVVADAESKRSQGKYEEMGDTTMSPAQSALRAVQGHALLRLSEQNKKKAFKTK